MKCVLCLVALALFPASTDGQPWLLRTLNVPGSHCFGYTLASGDFNGDGYSDVVASDWRDTSCVHLLFGPDLDSSLVFQVSDEFEDFGEAVANVGDVNGDGYPDLAVGAPATGLIWGKVYLYYGGANMDTVPDCVFLFGEDFGCTIKGADFNGDGFSDLAIGEPYEPGEVFIFDGGVEMDVLYDLKLEGVHAAFSSFGSYIDAGDLDGNGIADLVVGNPGEMPEGATYLFLSPLDSVAEIKLLGNYLGSSGSVGTTGDFDGDGVSELVVGNPSSYWCDVVTDTTPGISFGLDDIFASGDFNRDGIDDLLRGYNSDNWAWVDIYFGSVDFDSIPEFRLRAENPQEAFHAICSAGDINGDGWIDFMAGSPCWNGYQGQIYIYTLNPDVGTEKEDGQEVVKPSLALQNYPNPFGGLTTVAYSLSKPSHIRLSAYNLTGQLVATLVDQEEQPGEHTVCWQAERHPPGAYLLLLRAGDMTILKRVTILK